MSTAAHVAHHRRACRLRPAPPARRSGSQTPGAPPAIRCDSSPGTGTEPGCARRRRAEHPSSPRSSGATDLRLGSPRGLYGDRAAYTTRGTMATLTPKQEELCQQSRWDYGDLRALFISCTLKRSPEVSHTKGLADTSMEIMRRQGVTVDLIRAVDHDIATGVWPDMTEHGWERDDWPAIYEQVMAAEILVVCTPIWLGEKSSVCTQIIERLYGNSHLLNEAGQYAYYGRVGGCLVTGNEDGVKHCAMNVLYSLQHLGYVIPPQA